MGVVGPQPDALLYVTDTLGVAVLVQVTVIELVPAPLVIVPPFTVHAYDDMPASVEYTLPVELRHAAVGPAIVGLGNVFTTIF